MSISSIGKSTNMCEKCVNRKQFKTLTILLPENNFHFIQTFLYLHMYVFYTNLPIDFLTDIIIISRYGHFHSFCHNIIWCFITKLMIFSGFESMFLFIHLINNVQAMDWAKQKYYIFLKKGPSLSILTKDPPEVIYIHIILYHHHCNREHIILWQIHITLTST